MGFMMFSSIPFFHTNNSSYIHTSNRFAMVSELFRMMPWHAIVGRMWILGRCLPSSSTMSIQCRPDLLRWHYGMVHNGAEKIPEASSDYNSLFLFLFSFPMMSQRIMLYAAQEPILLLGHPGPHSVQWWPTGAVPSSRSIQPNETCEQSTSFPHEPKHIHSYIHTYFPIYTTYTMTNMETADQVRILLASGCISETGWMDGCEPVLA